MALFVQIDHFRKTDQKPTVKNHLFSISWFRSFNRTSFQQQLKQFWSTYEPAKRWASIVHPFNNNWNCSWKQKKGIACLLQSYILSTTTETFLNTLDFLELTASIVHPFNNNWNYILNTRHLPSRFNRTSFQQQLKLDQLAQIVAPWKGFNRTSFQQQLKRDSQRGDSLSRFASIVHPFNNNWNKHLNADRMARIALQSYILSTTT